MEIALYALGALFLAAGAAGLLVPVLPGAPLLFLGVLALAWAGHFARLGWGTLAAAGLIAAAIAAVDWIAGALGARAFGASRWGMAGAVAGGVVGLFFGLPGILLGPAVGAIAFELWKDPDVARAARAGLGVAVGYVLGTAVKVALGTMLLGIVALALVL